MASAARQASQEPRQTAARLSLSKILTTTLELDRTLIDIARQTRFRGLRDPYTVRIGWPATGDQVHADLRLDRSDPETYQGRFMQAASAHQTIGLHSTLERLRILVERLRASRDAGLFDSLVMEIGFEHYVNGPSIATVRNLSINGLDRTFCPSGHIEGLKMAQAQRMLEQRAETLCRIATHLGLPEGHADRQGQARRWIVTVRPVDAGGSSGPAEALDVDAMTAEEALLRAACWRDHLLTIEDLVDMPPQRRQWAVAPVVMEGDGALVSRVAAPRKTHESTGLM